MATPAEVHRGGRLNFRLLSAEWFVYTYLDKLSLRSMVCSGDQREVEVKFSRRGEKCSSKNDFETRHKGAYFIKSIKLINILFYLYV